MMTAFSMQPDSRLNPLSNLSHLVQPGQPGSQEQPIFEQPLQPQHFQQVQQSPGGQPEPFQSFQPFQPFQAGPFMQPVSIEVQQPHPNVVGNLEEVEEQAELARQDELDRRSQLSAPVMRTAVPQAEEKNQRRYTMSTSMSVRRQNMAAGRAMAQA